MEKVIWALPTSVDVNGTEYGIRSDYRAVLDILTALTDNELDDHLKAEAALEIFYPGFDEMPPGDYQEALNQCFRFIDRGQDWKEKKHEPALTSLLLRSTGLPGVRCGRWNIYTGTRF